MGTGYLPDDKKITKYYSAIIASTSAAALIMTVVCLNINNYFIYPHLYYIPIVIAAIIYPKKGVYFAILLAVLLIFISIVVTKGNIEIIRENLVNGIVFTGVGAIASALSDVLRSDSLKYQRLFENSGAATAVIDKSDKIIYCNKEFENISGYDLKEIKRKKWTDLISPDDLNKIFSDSELKTLQNPKNLKGIEVRILKNKGETRHTLASIHRILQLKITLFSIIDITEKKEAERVLKIKEERFKRLFQQSTDAVFIHSVNGKIFDANENACRMTGYTLESLKGMALLNLFYSDDSESVLKETEFLKKSGHCEFESRFIQPNGNVIEVDIRSYVIDRKTNVVQTIIRDITLRKRNESALLIASKKLSILSSITRHDIINQIMVALANMEFAAEDSEDKKILKHIEKAKTAVHTIQRQIEFSKDYQDMGGKPPKWQDVDNLIERCIKSQNVPDSVRVLKEACSAKIFADPMLEKVFCNLIGNSLMHGESVSEIKITTDKKDDYYSIIYSDNGKGIPDDKKELIFKAGYGSNQGFGLYLVREILSITDIKISETGVFGQGARFELLIHKNDFKFE